MTLSLPLTDPPRERILIAAVELFHARGPGLVSVDQILSLSKTGKSQFYHYFRNKDDLIIKVIEYCLEHQTGGMAALPQVIGSWDELESWLWQLQRASAGDAAPRMCPLGMISMHLQPSQVEAEGRLQRVLVDLRGRLAAFFVHEQHCGELPAAVEPQAIADYCMAVIEGGLLLARAEQSPTPLRRSLAELVRYFSLLRQHAGQSRHGSPPPSSRPA